MIRVTIEVLPEGDASKARVVADASIEHIGPYGRDRRGYRAAVVEEPCEQDRTDGWQGLETIAHRPSDGVVALVARALTRLVERR